MNVRLVAALLMMALPLAGCLEGGDGGDADTQGTTTSAPGTVTRTGTGGSTSTLTGGPTGTGTGSQTGGPGNGTGPVTGNQTGNATGNATGNQTGNATGNATWEYDNRTGTVGGLAVPIVEASFSEVEAVDVANGTLNLTLNLTSTGDAITITVAPPGCEEEDCADEVEAEDGRADFAYERPAEGEWTVTLSVSGAGPVEAEYELTVAQLVPGNGTA